MPRFYDIDLTDRLPANSQPRALVQFATPGFDAVLRGQRPAFFNPYGATVEIVRALNELGMRVDLIDASDDTFNPEHPYRLFVGHGPHYARTASRLSQECRKARYATGSHVRSFLRDSHERYRRFRLSRGLTESSDSIQREVDPATDYSQVDLLIALGELTAASYAREGLRAVHVHNAAYVDTDGEAAIPDKDWNQARHRFLYASGTRGSIQKGLDLLLEAFATQPQAHLFVYSKIDDEVLRTYGRELQLPNIHYVYHYAKLPRWKSRLYRQCAFTICAGINTGQSTAYLATLHEGFVPVYNAEADVPLGSCGLQIPRSDPRAIADTIAQAARIDAETLRRDSSLVRQRFEKHHRPECFCRDMKRHLQSLLK